MRILTRPLAAVLLPLALIVTGLIGLAGAGPADARTPAVPSGMGKIESLATYVAQSSCDPSVKPGTAKFIHLLLRTYPGTTAASAYACGTDGSVSEHYEGRAIDWMVSIHNGVQHHDAGTLIGWLLATDRSGNKYAMARRLGIQYIIFNNKMWGSWSGKWEPYNNCAKQPQAGSDNACHRTHMHISLSWNGAMGRTSYWTKHRVFTDYGPCRVRDLNWASSRVRTNSHRCPDYAKVGASAHASSTKAALVTYSGASLRLGSSGPAISAVQRALHVSASGSFGASTRSAVVAFQRAHHLTQSGSVGVQTWRTLLKAVK